MVYCTMTNFTLIGKYCRPYEAINRKFDNFGNYRGLYLRPIMA